MSNQHPLTDAKCRDIANNLCFRWPPHVDQGEVLYAEDDMRAAYDLGRDAMLEQVIEWMEANLMNHDFYKGYAYLCDNFPNVYIKEYELLEDLREAMRPATTTTTQEDS